MGWGLLAAPKQGSRSMTDVRVFPARASLPGLRLRRAALLRWLAARLHLPRPESFASPVEEMIALCRWFVRMRWVAIVFLLVTLAGTRWALGIPLALAPLLAIAAGLTIYNVLFYLYLPVLDAASENGHRQARRFANVQVLADLACVTALLHFSGGVENAMSAFYLFHIIIASVMLPKGQSYVQAVVAFSLFSALVCLEYWGVLPHHPLPGYSLAPHYRNWRFVFGHLAVLGLTLTLAAFFTSALAERLRERQAALAATSSRLGALEARKSRFMRVAAHQLREPISAIKSALAVALECREHTDEKDWEEMIRRAENHASMTLDLLGDLLALSRLRDARDDGDVVEPVCGDDILQYAVDSYRLRAQRRGQHLALRAEAGDALVLAAPEKLRDLFTNLLSNAVKYTPAGGTIRASSCANSSHVVFEVADSGIGIPLADRGRLCEEFFRGSNAREFTEEGTGLGLSIANEIVERAGGSLACDSEPGRGTQFTVTLPLAACAFPRRPTAAEASAPPAGEPQDDGRVAGVG